MIQESTARPGTISRVQRSHGQHHRGGLARPRAFYLVIHTAQPLEIWHRRSRRALAVIGAKSYFAKHQPPKTPRDLIAHRCINLRLPTYSGLYPWEFERHGRELKVRADGPFIFNSIFQIRDAALDGFGLADVPEDLAQPHLSKGRLIRVLQAWSPPWPGYHLYYPSRRQSSPAFALIIEALRYRADK